MAISNSLVWDPNLTEKNQHKCFKVESLYLQFCWQKVVGKFKTLFKQRAPYCTAWCTTSQSSVSSWSNKANHHLKKHKLHQLHSSTLLKTHFKQFLKSTQSLVRMQFWWRMYTWMYILYLVSNCPLMLAYWQSTLPTFSWRYNLIFCKFSCQVILSYSECFTVIVVEMVVDEIEGKYS